MSRWDSLTELYCDGPQDNSFVYDVFVKAGRAYVSWVDFSREESQTHITVFKVDDTFDAKTLKNSKNLESLFSHFILRDEKTDANKDQKALIDSMDLEMRGVRAESGLSNGTGYTGATLRRLVPSSIP